MAERRVWGELTRHFFRQFFENDVVQSDGDTVTTVVRALAAVAVPGPTVAFFLQNAYPARTAWGRIEDHMLFVQMVFVVVSGVALFEWEMLFPERLDFQVLEPLALGRWEMPMGKLLALCGFLGLFLLGASGPGAVMLALVSKEGFWRMAGAAMVASVLAGVFGTLLVLGTGALLLCVLPAAAWGRARPVLQTLAFAALLLLLLYAVLYGSTAEVLLQAPGTVARWMPTTWFLGVEELLLRGHGAAAFAAPMAVRAMRGLGLAAAAVVVLYPAAWARMQRLAMEGGAARTRPTRGWWEAMERAGMRGPVQRGVACFVGQTLLRASRNQVYVALYCGAGAALALGCAVRLQVDGARLGVALWRPGLEATVPLLLFWTVAGLRMTFAFPRDLPARWVFRVSGAELREGAKATRRWTMLSALVVLVAVLGVLAGLGEDGRGVLVAAVYGVCWSVVLVELTFFAQNGAPFTRPRAPGRTSLPLVLTLFVGVLPLLVIGMVAAERWAARRPGFGLVLPVLVAAGVLLLVRMGRERFVVVEEEGEGRDGEFQLLGLTGDLRA